MGNITAESPHDNKKKEFSQHFIQFEDKFIKPIFTKDQTEVLKLDYEMNTVPIAQIAKS